MKFNKVNIIQKKLTNIQDLYIMNLTPQDLPMAV